MAPPAWRGRESTASAALPCLRPAVTSRRLASVASVRVRPTPRGRLWRVRREQQFTRRTFAATRAVRLLFAASMLFLHDPTGLAPVVPGFCTTLVSLILR